VLLAQSSRNCTTVKRSLLRSVISANVLPIVLKKHAKLLLLLDAKTLLDLTFNVLFGGVPLRSLFLSLSKFYRSPSSTVSRPSHSSLKRRFFRLLSTRLPKSLLKPLLMLLPMLLIRPSVVLVLPVYSPFEMASTTLPLSLLVVHPSNLSLL
jgi:hypothetical protein